MVDRPMSLFLADDKLIVKQGVPDLISPQPNLTVVGVAADDYDGLELGAAHVPRAE